MITDAKQRAARRGPSEEVFRSYADSMAGCSARDAAALERELQYVEALYYYFSAPSNEASSAIAGLIQKLQTTFDPRWQLLSDHAPRICARAIDKTAAIHEYISWAILAKPTDIMVMTMQGPEIINSPGSYVPQDSSVASVPRPYF